MICASNSQVLGNRPALCCSPSAGLPAVPAGIAAVAGSPAWRSCFRLDIAAAANAGVQLRTAQTPSSALPLVAGRAAGWGIAVVVGASFKSLWN